MYVTMSEIDPQVQREVARRRTFAIISHPDAGKTTLTEKLLLFGGCIDVAGAVRGRKSQRAATSDWMELEKQRGISVSSTVLTFEFEGHQVNLLDTPGHHDFSEDTYRTLMAADCAVMVIDLAKGVEAQTEKLFRVCALRRIPVITFVNKVDRPGRGLLAMLAEIEDEIRDRRGSAELAAGHGAATFPAVIDVGDANGSPVRRAQREPPHHRTGPSTWPTLPTPCRNQLPMSWRIAVEEVELLATAGVTFDRERFLAGDLSPVFFGSALTNYGVEHFLRGFLALCPPPHDRESDIGKISVARQEFRGVRVQDPGQSRSAPSGPDRVRPRRARDGFDATWRSCTPGRARRSACVGRIASSGRNGKRWTRPFRATSSA